MGMPLATRRFTVDEFHRMAVAGIFHEDDRVELLDGHIVEMTPIGPGHSGCVGALTALLARQIGDTTLLWVQNPVRLGIHAEPQPDVALIQARPHGYRSEHAGPDDILLVIEVADTTPERDRDDKIPLYAQAGIPDVWLVHLPAQSIVVHREPRAGHYTSIHTARRGETLAPLLLPGIRLAVNDILG
jgi:Uma2 family endonuclease